MSKPTDSLLLPVLLNREIIFEESLIKIQRDELQVSQDCPYTYYSLLTPPLAVVIIATTQEGKYLLTKEYRHPTGQVLLGCPGGFVDPQEEVLHAAQRELQEETGFQAESFKVMGNAFPYAGISCQKTVYVKAEKAYKSTSTQLEASEIILPTLLTYDQILQFIASEAEIDANLCTALFFLKCCAPS